MLDLLNFTAFQWVLIVGLFAACVVVTERTLRGMKQKYTDELLAHQRAHGMADAELLEQKRHMDELSSFAIISTWLYIKRREK